MALRHVQENLVQLLESLRVFNEAWE